MTKSTNNPWLALSSYQEEQSDRFKGRHDESIELTKMIEQNDCVICYAASGDGKSSLINAGVCPLIRGKGLFPIKIVFTTPELQSKVIQDFNKLIWDKILDRINEYKEKFVKSRNLKSDDYNVWFEKAIEYENYDVNNSLWWKLRTETIQMSFGEFDYIPVLIFDQFEEVFRAPWKDQFFQWLEEMMRDVCPDNVIKDLKGRTDNLPSSKMFKMLFAMRYEFVGELDYWCSQCFYIPQMMRNRYFLKPLKTANAESIIEGNSNQGEEEISTKLSKKAKIIVNHIKGGSNSNNEISSVNADEVSAIALSLVCHVLYDRLENDTCFSLDNEEELEKTINNGIYEYYDNQLKALQVPQNLKTALEEVLSPNNERLRMPVSIPKLHINGIERFIGNDDDEEQREKETPNLISTHILKKETINGKDYIEFIHDRLVLAIKEHNDEMAAKEKERIAKEEIRRAEEEAKKAKEEMDRKTQEEAKKRRRLLHSIYWFFGSVVCLFIIGLGLRYFVGKPIVYNPNDIPQNSSIPRYSKPYSVPDSILVLNRCIVEPYTFYGNKDVRRLKLDSAVIKNKSLPDVDTLIWGEKQYKVQENDFLPKFKVGIFSRPLDSIACQCKYNIVDFDTVIVSENDSDYLRWHNGTLFARTDTNSAWHAIVSKWTSGSWGIPVCFDYGFFGLDSTVYNNVIDNKYNSPYMIFDYDLAVTNKTEFVSLFDSIVQRNVLNKDAKKLRYGVRVICNKPEIRRINMDDIPDRIKEYVFEINCKYIETISDSVFYNPNGLFNSPYTLRIVKLPSADTIGSYAFYENRNLYQLEIPNVKVVENYAFRYCLNLNSLEFNQVENIKEGSFYHCEKLRNVLLPKVSRIGQFSFEGCHQLQSIYLPSVDTIGSYAFRDCKAMQEVSLPQATSIGQSVFRDCIELQKVSIPNVTYLPDFAFNNCESISQLEMPRVEGVLGNYSVAIKEENAEVIYDKNKIKIGWGNKLPDPVTTNQSDLNTLGDLTTTDYNDSNLANKTDNSCSDTVIDTTHISKLILDRKHRNININCLTPVLVDTLKGGNVANSNTNGIRRYYHGDIIKVDTNGRITVCQFRTNRRVYVSVPPVYYSYTFYANKKQVYGDKYERYIALYRTDEIELFYNREASLYVPFGQLEFYQINYGDKFKEVKELSWICTIWYRHRYPTCFCFPKTSVFGWVEFRLRQLFDSMVYSSEWSDFFAFGSYVLFSIIIVLLLHWCKIRLFSKPWWKSKYFWRDMIVLVLLCLISGSIVFFKASEKTFSMWPIWYYAFPLWVVYVAVTTILQNRKKEIVLKVKSNDAITDKSSICEEYD